MWFFVLSDRIERGCTLSACCGRCDVMSHLDKKILLFVTSYTAILLIVRHRNWFAVVLIALLFLKKKPAGPKSDPLP